jgi:hypothetical protein
VSDDARELIRVLAVLAEPPDEEHARLGRVVGLPGIPDSAEYSDVFLFQLYPYASVHLGPEGMMGGEGRARVAGFWRAIGRLPPPEPDHLAALLGLYAGLSSDARIAGEPEAVLISRASSVLLREHLAPWVFAYLTRVRELTRGFYAEWAALLERVLRHELGGLSEVDREAETVPEHLRYVPAMPDPRHDGASDFLQAMLAPVRSGLILARADLARLAGDLGLGLRAGERRYALEHLLGQDPVAVLGALAVEADRQGAAHRERAPWLGGVADFCARRAEQTATLLSALAEESREHLATAAVGPTAGPTGR